MNALRLMVQTLRRTAPIVLLLSIALTSGPAASGDESLLPEDALLKVHVDPLGSFYEAPLVRQVWERLQSSRSVVDLLQTVEAQQVQEAVSFLEDRLGRPWQQIYTELTAGGVDLALSLEGEPQLLIIAHAADDQIAADFVKMAVELARADDAVGNSGMKVGEHRGITGYKLGDVVVAAIGPRLLIGSHPDLLKQTVDRILDGSADEAPEPADGPFRISARLDLNRLRSIPDVAKGLAIPSEDAGIITFFGGWIDLVRRHASAEIELHLGHDTIDAVVRFDGAPSPTQFSGFWAEAVDEHPAPLLQVPGTIYSTTWYRNYGALWDAREQLITAKAVEKMEVADSETAAQFESLGSAVSLSEVVGQFGPRFRIVVAEQTAPPYDVELRNQLPAAALVIELKDEDAFREISAPLARVLHLILSFEQKITPQPIDHAGATLNQLSFPHTEKDVARRAQGSYNFRPTHTITRGHFIIGSTPEIVRQTIDAIDSQAETAKRPGQSGVTSEQFIDVRRVVSALSHVRDSIVRQSVLGGGLDVETADHEFDVLLSVLGLFETESLTGVFTDNGFEYRFHSTTTDAPTNPDRLETTLAD